MIYVFSFSGEVKIDARCRAPDEKKLFFLAQYKNQVLDEALFSCAFRLLVAVASSLLFVTTTHRINDSTQSSITQ